MNTSKCDTKKFNLLILKKSLKFTLNLAYIPPFMIIALLKWLLYDFIMSIYSKKSYRNGALEDIGLIHQGSILIKEFGKISGSHSGYEIEIEPFKPFDSVVVIQLKNKTNLNLSTQKPSIRTSRDKVKFKTSNATFNLAFGVKEYKQDIINPLINNTELINLLNDFYIKWFFKIDVFSISYKKIYVRYTNPTLTLIPYITPKKAKQLIKELIPIVKKIDELNITILKKS